MIVLSSSVEIVTYNTLKMLILHSDIEITTLT